MLISTLYGNLLFCVYRKVIDFFRINSAGRTVVIADTDDIFIWISW